MWAEAGLLAALLEKDRPEAVLSFAPPKHVYGALAGVLVPALLGLPAWYRPRYFGAPPAETFDRWAVVAVPWTFSILLRGLPWVRAAEHMVVLHSTARLPDAAAELMSAAGPERVRIVEVFGSTEAGGIASRTWAPQEQAWELFDDVDFALGTSAAGAPAAGDVALAVRSPRLAFAPGGARPSSWVTDDLIEPLGAREFRFAGRSSRLVKVNGLRVNLDDLEESLRRELRCADLAFLPIADAVSGEHVDLLVVPEAGHPLTETDVRAAVAGVGALPRNVSVVDRIDRSATGKLRRLQPPSAADAGATT
jgi:acyl-coenzyme A synthetase/AMP-(fatty) acid ligase